MTTPVFDEPMYSLAVFPGSAGWFFIAEEQRQSGRAERSYRHYLPPGSYMISATLTGTAGMDLSTYKSGVNTLDRRINLVPDGVDGTTRSGSTTISITGTTTPISFQPPTNFTQAQLSNAIAATVQIVKIPSYVP